MKYLVMVLILMFTLPTMADVSTSGLTATQKATLEAQKAQMKLDNATGPSITGDVLKDVIENPDLVNKYAQVGQAIAQSIGAAARELGVEVNNFAGTGVGKLVMFMTVYHFFGADIVTFVVGFFFMIPMSLWIIFRMNKMIKTKEINYDVKGKEIGRVFMNAAEMAHSTHDGTSAFAATVAITVIGFGLIVIQAFVYLP